MAHETPRSSPSPWRAAAFVALLFGTPGRPGAAQELLFLAPAIEALWTGDDGRLFVQHGLRVQPLSGDGASGGGHAEVGLDPATTWFDMGREMDLVFPQLASAGDVRIDTVRPVLRRAAPGPPIRLPLRLGGGISILPSRPAWKVVGWDPRGVVEVEVPLGGRSDLGWGAGDDLVVTTVLPHASPRSTGAAGPPDIVIGSGAAWSLHSAGGRPPRRLKPPPGDAIDGIMDFPHAIPPLVADLDGKGGDDLVLCDPSAGAAAVYSDFDAEEPGPSRVILVGGVLLWAWSGDFDADGRADLVLLKLPKLSLAAQLRIVSDGRMRADLLFYPGRTGEGLPDSPSRRRAVDLPIRIGIANELRTVKLPALLAPLPGPAILSILPDGRAALLPFDEDGKEKTLHTLPAGESLEPFSVHALLDGAFAFGWATSADARVYSVR